MYRDGNGCNGKDKIGNGGGGAKTLGGKTKVARPATSFGINTKKKSIRSNKKEYSSSLHLTFSNLYNNKTNNDASND
jgi:hypothetical protein